MSKIWIFVFIIVTVVVVEIALRLIESWFKNKLVLLIQQSIDGDLDSKWREKLVMFFVSHNLLDSSRLYHDYVRMVLSWKSEPSNEKLSDEETRGIIQMLTDSEVVSQAFRTLCEIFNRWHLLENMTITEDPLDLGNPVNDLRAWYIMNKDRLDDLTDMFASTQHNVGIGTMIDKINKVPLGEWPSVGPDPFNVRAFFEEIVRRLETRERDK